MRGCDCFVVQSTCAPANSHLMELLIMIDALRALVGAAHHRRDALLRLRAPGPQGQAAHADPAKLVADLISTAGADRVLCIDLHAGQIQGFFNIPVDHLFATPVLLDAIREPLRRRTLVIVSPDAGGVERARAYAKRLERDAGDHRQAPRGAPTSPR